VALGESVYLVDPLALDLRPLLERLAAARVVVVGHALDSDLRALVLAGLPLPSVVFDTQLAAGFCGHDPQMGLAALLRHRLRVELNKAQRTSDWTCRPLSSAQRRYAVQDVAHLGALAELFRTAARGSGRLAWVAEENVGLLTPSRYAPPPEDAWRRVKGSGKLDARERAVAREVARLRLDLARHKDMPLRHVFADDIVLALAQHPPRRVDDLRSNRRIKPHLINRHGAALVEAVQAGLRAPPIEVDRASTPSREDTEVVALLAIVLGRLARANQVASTHLLNKAGLNAAVRARPGDVASFCAAAGLDGWRAELAGGALYAVYSGRVGLAIEPGPQPRLREIPASAQHRSSPPVP